MEVRNMAEPISARQVERILREVSRDFAGAHVNADVVIDAVRRALRAGVIWPSGNGPAKATPSREEIDAGLSPAGGYTRAQLAQWGIPWPPPRGWKRRLERLADEETLRRARAARGQVD
jgi:hypothetical protein